MQYFFFFEDEEEGDQGQDQDWLLMQGRMKVMGMMSLVGDSRTFLKLAEGLIRANNSTYNMMMIIKSQKNHDMCVESFQKRG